MADDTPPCDGRIDFLSPMPPNLNDVSPYYAMAEERRWYSNFGVCHELLAERLAHRLGSGIYALPVANCTLGLMIALRALLGTPKPGRDRVIVPSFTFVGTLSAIMWSGFKPLFADVEATGWHLDPEAIRLASARGDVAGVLAAATFGVPPASSIRSAWRDLCGEFGLPLVVDSAAGFGAIDDRGEPLGASGDLEVFSFHATKTFAVGEGGAIVCRDKSVHDTMRALVNFGMDSSRRVIGPIGFNAKMSEIGAAFGLAMLDQLDEHLAIRRRLGERYSQGLGALGFAMQRGVGASAWQFAPTLVPLGNHAGAVLDDAEANGIQLRRYYDAGLHTLDGFGTQDVLGSLVLTEELTRRALALPLSVRHTKADVDRVLSFLGTCSS